MKLGDHFKVASADLREQYSIAKAGQWVADDIPWNAHDLVLASGVPAKNARAARRDLVAAFEGWSDALLGLASRLASELTNADAQLLLAVHARDCARHVEVWRLYAYHMDGDGAADTRGLDLPPVPAGTKPAAAVHIQRIRTAALRATYAHVETAWPCPLGRHVCGRLRADLDQQVEALSQVAAHCPGPVNPPQPEAVGVVPESTGRGVICYGMEQALRAELGDVEVAVLSRTCAAAVSEIIAKPATDV